MVIVIMLCSIFDELQIPVTTAGFELQTSCMQRSWYTRSFAVKDHGMQSMEYVIHQILSTKPSQFET